MNTTRADTLFRFPLGTVVTWARSSRPSLFLIVQRRYTERDLLGPLTEYLLGSCDHPETPLQWAQEPDILYILSRQES